MKEQNDCDGLSQVFWKYLVGHFVQALHTRYRTYLGLCLLLSLPLNQLAAEGTTDHQLERLYELLQQAAYQPLLDSCDHYLSATKSPTFRADLLTIKGNALRRMSQTESALGQHQQALKLRQEIYGIEALKVSSSLLNIANCYQDLQVYAKALVYFKQAKQIKEKQLPPNDRGLMKIYTNLGNVYQLLNQPTNAVFYFRKVIAIDRLTTPQLSPAAIAALNGLVNHFTTTNQLDSAFFYNQQAIELQENAAVVAPQSLAVLYNQQANILVQKGQIILAIQLAEKALNTTSQSTTIDANNHAACLQTLGNCYLELGDWEKAMGYFEQAQQLFSNLTDKVAVQNSIGLLLKYQGETEAAANQFTDGISILLGNPDFAADESYLLATLYTNLGNCFLAQQTSTAALFYFKKAIKIYTGLNKTAEIANGHNKIGQAFFQQAAYTQAENAYQQALKITTNITANYSSCFLLGILKAELQQSEAALIYYQKAAKAIHVKTGSTATIFPYESIQVNIAIAEELQNIAQVSQKAIDWKVALTYADTAIVLIENLKGQLKSSNSEIDLLNTFYEAYNIAIRASLALKKEAMAYAYANACKGSVLTKLLYQNQYKATYLSDTLVRQDIALGKEIVYYEKQKQALVVNDFIQLNTSKIAVINTKLFPLNQTKSKLQEQLKIAHPNYFSIKNKTQQLTISEIQATLTEAETMLQYHWLETSLLTFILTKDTFVMGSIPKGVAIKKAVKKLYNLSSQPPIGITQGNKVQLDTLVRTSHYLYQQLIRPYEHLLQEKLRIIPDAWLYYLPFESLITKATAQAIQFNQHEYLLAKYQIQYGYKATVNSTPRISNPSNPLIALAPSFKGNRQGLEELVNNVKEAKDVCQITNGLLVENEGATVNKYLALSNNYQIIHLSTHGVINNRNPVFSYLAFSPTTADNRELLYAQDIALHPLQANLVVLSACQTANGQLVRGEGLLSIAQAFFSAGAKSLVAALWNVDDERTTILFNEFYQQLKQKKDKPLALQQAKLQYLSQASRLDAHPYYWAGFVGLGDPSALSLNQGTDAYWLFFVGGLLLVLYFFFKVVKKSITPKHKQF